MWGYPHGTRKDRKRILNDISIAYSVLDEEFKCQISVGISSRSPGMFKRWLRLAGLSRGGFQPQKVAKRAQDLHRERLDSAFGSDDGVMLLSDLACCFFVRSESTLNGFFLDVLPKDEDILHDEHIDEALTKVRAVHGDNPFCDLFVATLADHRDGICKSNGVRCPAFDDEEARDVDDSRIIQTDLSCLETALQEIDNSIAPLRFAHEIDQARTHDLIKTAAEQAALVRTHLAEAANTVGLPAPTWKSREDLASTIGRIEGAQAQASLKKACERLLSVADLLQSLNVSCSPLSREKRVQREKDDAVKGLRAAASAVPAPSLPGPVEAEAWLSWVLALTDTVLDEVIEELDRIDESLARFIDTCRGKREWLASAAPQKDVTTDRTLEVPIPDMATTTAAIVEEKLRATLSEADEQKTPVTTPPSVDQETPEILEVSDIIGISVSNGFDVNTDPADRNILTRVSLRDKESVQE